MTWSYDDTDLQDSTPAGRLNIVRLIIGDTDSNDQLLQNEEIAYFLGEASDDPDGAAVFSVEAILALFARQVAVTQGPVSWGADKRIENFERLAARLRQKQARNAAWFAGGLTKSGKKSLDDDTDAVQPAFRVGQDDYYQPDPTLDN